MPVPPRRSLTARAAVAAAPPGAWSAGLVLGGIGLWLAAMAPRLEAQALFGPICSDHGSLFAAHCPACYAAAALAALGVAIAPRQLVAKAG